MLVKWESWWHCYQEILTQGYDRTTTHSVSPAYRLLGGVDLDPLEFDL